MQIGTEFSGQSTLTIENALLFYSTVNGRDTAMVTLHDVKTKDGQAVIMPGTVINGKKLRHLLDVGQYEKAAPFIPANVLQLAPGVITWFRKSHEHHILFKIRDKSRETGYLNKVSGMKVRYPNLIFQAKGKDFSVFAVKTSRRPDKDAELYQAPFYNIWDSGKICLGDSSEGMDHSPRDILRWEDLFFDSMFSHSNTPKIIKGTSHNKFWKGYCQQCKKKMPAKFPNEVLIPLNRKVRDIL